MAKKKDKDYCGIIFLGGGSAWAWAATPEEAAVDAAKECRKEWGSMYKLTGKFKVNILDMRKHEGWDASTDGIYDSETGELLKVMKIIEI